MKLEVGKTYEYDPEHPKCCFITKNEITPSLVPEITITKIYNGWVYYKYNIDFESEQLSHVFIAALTPLTSLEKELY